MDTGKGIFEQIEEEKFQKQMEQEKSRVFKVGEILEVRGSRLRVEQITRNKITFKLLKALG